MEWGSKRQRAAIERVERLCGGVSVVTGTNGNIEVVSPTFFFVYASILDATVPSGEMMREANNYERVFAGGSRRSAKKGKLTFGGLVSVSLSAYPYPNDFLRT